jgi:hypothetical protein
MCAAQRTRDIGPPKVGKWLRSASVNVSLLLALSIQTVRSYHANLVSICAHRLSLSIPCVQGYIYLSSRLSAEQDKIPGAGVLILKNMSVDSVSPLT